MDELIEIDENLCRSELTAMQRSSHVKRRKAIWEAMHPTTICGRDALPIEVEPQGEIQVGEVFPPVIGYGTPPPQTKSFAAETAAITGESKRSINQHVARAEALGDDLDRLVGTSLDKGVEADALIKLPEPERKELIERAVAGEIVTARFVNLDSLMKGELAENEFRKEFTPSERVAIGEAIERELEGRRGTNQHTKKEGVENFPQAAEGEKTRDIAAKAAGFGNGKTYEQAKKVSNEAAPELVQAMAAWEGPVPGLAGWPFRVMSAPCARTHARNGAKTQQARKTALFQPK